MNFLLSSKQAEGNEGVRASSPLKAEVDRRKIATEETMLQLEQVDDVGNKITERMCA